MLGVADTTLGTLTDTTKDWFHRDYRYDSVLRPWSVATHIPAGSDGGVSWTNQDFTVESAYDRNYGRMKAMSSPKPNQEFVRFDYDARGNPLGETPFGANGSPPARAVPYRLVKSMSVRGQVTEQLFGNGVDETTDFDDSTGQPLWISATGLHEPSTACPTAATPLVRQLTYRYDHFLNLASQEKDLYKRDSNGVLSFNACAPVTLAATEKYSYDELQRLTQTTRSWTNLTPDAIAAAPTQYGYSDLGNFTSKSDYAPTYTYPASGANTYTAPGPHAVVEEAAPIW